MEVHCVVGLRSLGLNFPSLVHFLHCIARDRRRACIFVCRLIPHVDASTSFGLVKSGYTSSDIIWAARRRDLTHNHGAGN